MASTTARHMMVCDLIERNRAATRCTLTERAALLVALLAKVGR
jgi:hypothetical protein